VSLCLSILLQLYRIQNPQAPLVQNQAQRGYCYDEYPSGANAVVAVISYTGFDMEDAMIINKSSFERGFGHASVYKTIVRVMIVGGECRSV
jgi:DNA-directed RNA polymerase I subunit RPA2